MVKDAKLIMKINFWRAKLRVSDSQVVKDECVKQLELLDKEYEHTKSS